MAFQPCPDVARFAMEFLWQGELAVNVYHMFLENGWNANELETACAALKDWWDDDLKAEVSSTVTLETIRARDLSSETGAQLDYTTGLPITAGSAAASAPNNCTFAVQWRTALSGRSYRGRTFHVGLTTTKYSANQLTPANATEFETIYGGLIEAIGTAGYNMVVLSRYANGTQRNEGVYTNITSCRINRVLDSMRRRLPGRGA